MCQSTNCIQASGRWLQSRRVESHPIRVNEVRTSPFSCAHPTRPTGCTTVLHTSTHPHTRISCPPRARDMRASERASVRGSAAARARARVHFAGNDSTWSHGREMKSESTKAGTKKSLRNSRERSPRGRRTSEYFVFSTRLTKIYGIGDRRFRNGDLRWERSNASRAQQYRSAIATFLIYNDFVSLRTVVLYTPR